MPAPPPPARTPGWRSSAARLLALAIGDPHRFPLDHRLFNSVSLLNTVTNIGGLPSLWPLQNAGVLMALNLGTGLIFLGFYGLARFRGVYRPLYWPFVLTIATFLFANMVFNAGSAGGAVWYLVPALIIATALAPRTRDAVLAAVLFGSAAVGILIVEQRWPGWIRPYGSANERLADVAGNMLFAQWFSAGLVWLLARTLNAERHRSEVLLLNVLPREIAAELKREGRVEPHHYDHATVLFTDFVGFTRIAESLTPAQLIARLDEAFQEFDRIVQTHGLEKIKTIGDAYLAVGGIPRENPTHALDCALAALELVRATERLRLRHESTGEPAWSLRVGLHSGPLVAGVIGTEKFAYDVWGDTVNTASRLESSGIPGQINLSAATQQELAEFFECESRGRIEAKGKGELEMFLLRGLRPEFVEADGTPNARFWEGHRRIPRNTSGK